MTLFGGFALQLYSAAVMATLAAFFIYRRRHITDLVAGRAAHFEPMVQTSEQALSIVTEEVQPDLFDDSEAYTDVAQQDEHQ